MTGEEDLDPPMRISQPEGVEPRPVNGWLDAVKDTDQRVAVLLIVLTVAVLVELAVIAWLAWRLNMLDTQLNRACGPGGVVSRLDLTEWVGICQGRDY